MYDQHDEPDLIVVSVTKAPSSRRRPVNNNTATTNTRTKRVFVIDSDPDEPPRRKSTRTPQHLPQVALSEPAKETPRIDVRCPICLETPRDPASTMCGHVFCWRCIQLSLQEFRGCPTCRKKLTTKSVHRLFLG